MDFITIKEASERMKVPVQQVRVMIQRGKIPGAFTMGTGKRRSYYITDQQITNVMNGRI